jgi:hypothetical protein
MRGDVIGGHAGLVGEEDDRGFAAIVHRVQPAASDVDWPSR